jgi:hypothetical protein
MRIVLTFTAILTVLILAGWVRERIVRARRRRDTQAIMIEIDRHSRGEGDRDD